MANGARHGLAATRSVIPKRGRMGPPLRGKQPIIRREDQPAGYARCKLVASAPETARSTPWSRPRKRREVGPYYADSFVRRFQRRRRSAIRIRSAKSPARSARVDDGTSPARRTKRITPHPCISPPAMGCKGRSPAGPERGCYWMRSRRTCDRGQQVGFEQFATTQGDLAAASTIESAPSEDCAR